MNGGASQFARVLATLTPIATRCVVPDFDAIQTCSDEEWEDLMRARYGENFETRDFTVGPPEPALSNHSDRI